jgi:hypothetical protein
LYEFRQSAETLSGYKVFTLSGRTMGIAAGRQARDGGQRAAEAAGAKQPRPLAGFLIAGASLAALFAIAALKGRVKDDHTDKRGDK